MQISPADITLKELSIHGTIFNPFRFPSVAGLVAAMPQQYRSYDKLGIKEYSLDDHHRAFDDLRMGKVSKAVFNLESMAWTNTTAPNNFCNGFYSVTEGDKEPVVAWRVSRVHEIESRNHRNMNDLKLFFIDSFLIESLTHVNFQRIFVRNEIFTRLWSLHIIYCG